jgi:hypothetical protein
MFFRNVGIKGGPASVSKHLLIARLLTGKIEPGRDRLAKAGHL